MTWLIVAKQSLKQFLSNFSLSKFENKSLTMKISCFPEFTSEKKTFCRRFSSFTKNQFSLSLLPHYRYLQISMFWMNRNEQIHNNLKNWTLQLIPFSIHLSLSLKVNLWKTGNENITPSKGPFFAYCKAQGWLKVFFFFNWINVETKFP